jgi:hypothetical protein
MKRVALLLIATALMAKRAEYLNSTGKDGRFHLDKRMYLCLNFGFNPGEDIRDDSSLKGELLFDGIDGHDDLTKAAECTPVTSQMIDRVNFVLDKVAPLGPMREGERRTVK